MRILHLISGIDPANGGPTFALERLAAAQVALGDSVHVMATWRREQGRDNAATFERHGIRVSMVGRARTRQSWHPTLRRRVRGAVAGADVVHIHALWEDIQHFGAVAARCARKPCIFSPHGMLDRWSLSQNSFLKRLYWNLRLGGDLRRASAIHVHSAMERDDLTPLRLGTRVIVEPYGLELAEFEQLPERGYLRDRFGLDAATPIIAFLGRMDRKKGIDLLVRAFATLGPQVRLALLGPDYESYQATIESLASELGVRDRVLLPGMLHGNDRIAALVDADVFCLPSYEDSYGIVVAEAMACGRATIVSSGVGAKDDVRAADCGEVVEPRVEPLAAALTKWLGDPALRAAAGHRARAFAFERFAWTPIARRWQSHYTRLIANTDTSGRM